MKIRYVGPLPLIISQGIFLKFNRIVVALLALSLLLKLASIAVALGEFVN